MDLDEFIHKKKRETGMSATQIAEEIGCTKNALSGVSTGRVAVGKVLADRIEKYTNGKVKRWEMIKYYQEIQERKKKK